MDIANDSNMGSFIYETVYDAASTIDYSKDPIDAGVVDSPPAKKVFRHSPSPSPLKGLQRTCVRSRPVGAGAPQRRLRMDAHPTSSGQTRDPLRGAMPVQANSDASVPRTKVPYISTLLSYNEGLVKLFRSSSLNSKPVIFSSWYAGCVHPQASAVRFVHRVGTLQLLAPKSKALHVAVFEFIVLSFGRATYSKHYVGLPTQKWLQPCGGDLPECRSHASKRIGGKRKRSKLQG